MRSLFRYISILSIVLIIGGFSVSSTYAQSENLPNPDEPVTNYNFEGIVKLSNCSGSLVRFENSKDTDPAMVLTNGHCHDSLVDWLADPDRYVYRANSTARFELMNAEAQTVAELQADQVIYSTMAKTDITLYRLNTSFAEILTNYGVHALTLSSQHPAVNTPIDIISGFWNRGHSCEIEAFIPYLREAKWVWSDSIRYSQSCDMEPGTSGSPVIQRGTRTVIGINNTGTTGGIECALNNPCEVDDEGKIKTQPDYSYGQQTYEIYSCLTPANEFDLSVAGCKLPHENGNPGTQQNIGQV